MFEFVTHTWNPMGGKCPHECRYCYVNRQLAKPVLAEKYSGEPRFVGKAFSPHVDRKVGDLTIFVEDMGDMGAENVPQALVDEVMRFIWKYPRNTYLFLSKNPAGFRRMRVPGLISGQGPKLIFGTTIETSLISLPPVSKAPNPMDRITELVSFKWGAPESDRFFLSFEPIMDFDMGAMKGFVRAARPDFVAIGADSGDNNLPEPDAAKVEEFAMWLRENTGRVYLKKNLERIVGAGFMKDFEQAGVKR